VGERDTAETESEIRGVRPDPMAAVCVCEGKTLCTGITDFSHGHSADFGKFFAECTRKKVKRQTLGPG